MTETNIINNPLSPAHPAEVDSCGCAIIPEKIVAPMKAECPMSGTLSKKVLHETLDNLIVQDKKELISKIVQYYYCSDPDCSVVYFSNEKVPLFEKSDLRVKVFSKDSNMDVNVCYCYDWTRSRISEQINATGSSTAFEEVTEQVKAGNCECEIKNPKGDCCLGDIQTFLKEIS